MKLRWIAWSLLAVLIAGCAEEDKAPPVPRMDGGSGTKSQRAGRGGAGEAGSGGADAAVGDAGDGDASVSTGPLVEIVAPTAAADPNDDEVFTTINMRALCRVTPRDDANMVNRSSVKIWLDDPRDATKRIEAPTDALAGNEYKADFVVQDLPNGRLRVHCEAKDLAATPNTSSTTLETFLDLGPTITFLELTDQKPVPLKVPTTVTFTVAAAPIAAGDDEAGFDMPELKVLGKPIEVSPTPSVPGQYQANVDFDDTDMFPQPPTSADFVVTATNRRSPTPATRTAKVTVKIDSEGPTIVVNAPTANKIVHGRVVINLTVTDPSGIADANAIRGSYTVGTLTELTDWTAVGAGVYTTTFETTSLPTMKFELTLNFTARDRAGNETTVPLRVLLDDQPPLLSLDPPLLREYRGQPEHYYCSAAFDPLGDAVGDLATVGATSRYRLMVEDQTNFESNDHVRYYAGVHGAKVELFAQPDPSIPLLIDVAPVDGTCDQINENAMPTKPTVRKLSALDPKGTAWYPRNELSFVTDNPEHDVTGGGCELDPNGPTMQPATLCDLTDMFRVVPARIEGIHPAIFALEPTNGSTGECEGTKWALAAIVGDGWACVAARAEDTVGNVGVSAPIRVCFDHPDVAGVPDCSPELAPNCTDGCTPPPGPLSPTEIYRQK